jgi:hypothetical protein
MVTKNYKLFLGDQPDKFEAEFLCFGHLLCFHLQRNDISHSLMMGTKWSLQNTGSVVRIDAANCLRRFDH